MITRGKTRKGFTLIEVLTVVGIVGTLAGTLFAMFGTTQGRAKVVRCATNMDQIGKSLMLYVADHDDNVPPFLNFAEDKGVLLTPTSESPWRAALQQYTRSSDVFFCPDDPFAVRLGGLPGVSLVDHRQTSYANADWLQRHTFNNVLRLNLGQVEEPAAASYLLDDATSARMVKGEVAETETQHGDRPNVLFLDGHVMQPRKLGKAKRE
jgi:prepilin-type N-terminal cleavage/methylation domain-containing protein/prepilin-type processing-associated H-X9-DG protein